MNCIKTDDLAREDNEQLVGAPQDVPTAKLIENTQRKGVSIKYSARW